MTSPAEERAQLPLTPELLHDILTQTAERPGADYRVLMFYVTEAPLGDTVRLTAKEIAPQLHLSPGSLSRSITRLRDEDWLEVAYKVGHVPFYRVGNKVMELALRYDQVDDRPLADVHHLPIRSVDDEQ